MRCIGVDIHKKQLTVCYRIGEKQQIYREFENSQIGLQAFIDSVNCFDSVAIETGCFTRNFVKKVKGHIHKLIVVNTSSFKLIANSITKTDKHDAARLAYGLEIGILPVARVRSEASQRLRSMITARNSLIKYRSTIAVKMHSILSRNGINVGKDAIRTKANRDLFNESIFEAGDWVAWSVFNRQLISSLSDLNFIDLKIRDAAMCFSGYETLASIPGIGPVTTEAILGYIDDINDFRNSKAFCAFFGIVPRTRMSDGKPILSKFKRFKSGAITKRGCAYTRSTVTMSVFRLIRHNDTLKDFYEKIKGRKGYRKASTATARKFLTFLYFALKRGGPISDFGAVNFAKPGELTGV